MYFFSVATTNIYRCQGWRNKSLKVFDAGFVLDGLSWISMPLRLRDLEKKESVVKCEDVLFLLETLVVYGDGVLILPEFCLSL
jgi:hypothetical protein